MLLPASGVSDKSKVTIGNYVDFHPKGGNVCILLVLFDRKFCLTLFKILVIIFLFTHQSVILLTLAKFQSYGCITHIFLMSCTKSFFKTCAPKQI